MPFTVDRPPSTPEELYWYVRMRFGVAVPRTRVCPDHVPPFTAFSDAFFARNSLDPDSAVQSLALWHGSRGLSGKSFMLSLLAVVTAELLGADVNLLGGSLAQSLNIHEHVGTALDYEHAPDYMIVERTNSKITYTNKARIRPLTASQKTVRGPHPPRLLLDEIDEMELAILDAALGQPMRQRNYLRQIVEPHTVMCSTWQNPQGCVHIHTPVQTLRGEVPINKVKVGDFVPTRAGWREVTNVLDTGNQECVTVRFRSGRQLTCTPWHPVWTSDGWVEASRLAIGAHVVAVVSGMGRLELGGALPDALSTAHSFPGTLQSSGEPEVMAMSAMSGWVAEDVSHSSVVDRDGHRFQMVQSDTSPATAADLVDVVERQIVRNGSVNLDPNPTVSQKHALVRNKVPIALVPVAVAGNTQRPEDVPISVGEQIEGYAFADDEVVNVNHTGIVLPTFDLTVAGCHEYVADGIMVHNTFTEIKRRAEERGIPVYQWCFLESANPVDGWLAQETIDEKRASIPKQMWETEYCCSLNSHITTAEGVKQLGQVRIGDRVLTRSGYREVLKTWDNGMKPTLTIVFASGRTLTCTSDHRVATLDGWTRAEQLRVGSCVVASESWTAGAGADLVTAPSNGHSLSVALTALPVATSIESDFGRGMSVLASAVSSVPSVRRPFSDVLGASEQFEMVRVAAQPPMAPVLDCHSRRDGAVLGDVSQPMDQVFRPSDVQIALAVPGSAAALACLGVLPDPAPLVVDGTARSQVTKHLAPTGDLDAFVVDHVVKVSPNILMVHVGDLTVDGAHEYIANGIVVHNCLNEPSIGNRAFDTASVDRAFSLMHEPDPERPQAGGYLRHKIAKDFEEFVYEHPIRGAEYVVAADWAKEKDYTVIGVGRIDSAPFKLVYYMKVNRRPYPQMVGFFNKAINRYRAEASIHDSTGVGVMVDDYVDTSARGFTMTGEKRDAMLTEYVSAIENDEWRLPRTPSNYIAHKYCVGAGSLIRTMRGLVPIEQVQIGDYAQTRKGYRRVTGVLDNGQRLVWRLRLSDGSELRLTGDHAVATANGWVEAQHLQPGDVCFVARAESASSTSLPINDEVRAGLERSNEGPVGGPMRLSGVARLGGRAADSITESADSHRPKSAHSGAVVAAASEPVGIAGFIRAHVVDCNPTYELDSVWDIEVDGEHEFVANGIVVHNCQVGDLYSRRTSEFHLPDEVAMMGLMHHLARTRVPLVAPPDMSARDRPQTKHEKAMDPPPPRGSGPVVERGEDETRRVGDVVKVSEGDYAYSLG